MSMKAGRYPYLLLLLSSLLLCMRISAQGICAGSALAPVFKQTFGTSPSSSTKTTVPPGFLTNYAFNGSSSLADGQYMVTPLVQNSQKNDWAVGGDHTGDVNGNMFLVNAGTGASLFFKQQVNNLCPGSVYSFSAWLVNVNTVSATQPICGSGYVYPNVTFNIKDTFGVILQSYNTGNIPFTANRTVPPNWQQYGFQFVLPSGTTSLVLEMVDSYGGLPQCGNDLAIDDIVFSACTPQATASLNTSNAICAGSNTSMSVSLMNSSYVQPAYQWQKSMDGGISWTNAGIAGTGATSLDLNKVSTADGGLYRVIVGPDVASLSSNTCITASNSISLTVNALPTANVTTNLPICVGGNISLQANAGGGLSPYTYEWSGPSFSSALMNPVITNVDLTAQTGSYALTVTDANFCSVTTATNLSVNALPGAANAGTDQLVCQAAVVTLNGNIPPVGMGTWTQSAGPSAAIFINAFQHDTHVNGLIPGVYQFTWTVTNRLCGTNPDDVIITVNPTTVAGSLSADTTVCAGLNNGSFLLNGYTGNVVHWESSVDNGANWITLANTNAFYTYRNLSATTKYRVLVQNDPCTAVYSNTITVTVNQPAVAGSLSADTTVCAGINNGSLLLNGYTGNVVHWESSDDNGANWIIIANTNAFYTYQNLSATTKYRVLVQNDPCTAVYSNTITVTVNQPAVAGSLSADTTVCAGLNNGSLLLNGYTGNVVHWESSNDNGANWITLANTNAFYTYRNLSATTKYRVLVQNDPCSPVYSNIITITVNQPAIAGLLSADTTVCAGLNNGTLLLNGYTGNVVHWESSDDNGANWNILANTNAFYTYRNLSVTTKYRVLVQNDPCTPVYSNTITITVNQPAIAGSLSADTIVCSGSNNGALLLNGYTGNVVHWESSDDNGANWIILANTNAFYNYRNLSATTKYRVLVQNDPCTPVYSNTITITVNRPAIAGSLSADTIVCSVSNNGTLLLNGYTGNVVHWESSDDNGANWIILANTNAFYTYQNLSATTKYRVLVQNDPCTAVYSNTITVTVNQPAVAGSLSADTTVCAGLNNGSLLLNGYTGNVVHWESSDDNGANWIILANTNAFYTYRNLSVTTKYRVLVQNDPCTAVYSNTITITVNQPAIAGSLSADTTVCAGLNNGSLLLNGYTGNVVHWESSTDSVSWIILPQTASTYTYHNLSATTIYRAVVQNGVCASATSNPVYINVMNAVSPAVAGADQANCNTNSIVLNGNTPLNGNGAWRFITGPSTVSFSNVFSNQVTVNGLIPGTYRFAWTISNGVCTDSKDTVEVINYSSIQNTIDSSVQTVCKTKTVVVTGVPVTGGAGVYKYQWEKSFDDSNWITITNATAASYSFIADTSIFLRRTVSSAPCSSASNITRIIVLRDISNNIISGNQSVCKGSDSVLLTGNIPAGGGGNYRYRWEKSMDSGFTWLTINRAATQNLMLNDTIQNTTFIRRIVTTSSCNGAQSDTSNAVVISVSPVAAASLQYKGGVYCSINQKIEFTAITSNVDSIRWNLGDGTIFTSSGKNISHTYTKAGSFMPSVQLVNADGCVAAVPAGDSIHIDQVNTGFKLSAVYNCGQTTYRFTDTSQSYSSITQRIWTIGNQQINGGAVGEQVYQTAGDYEIGLQVHNQSGCTDSLQAKFTVTIYNYPQVNIDAVEQACMDKLMELKSEISSNDSIKARIWNLGNGSNASDSIVKVQYFSEGKYIVKLTVATVNSCLDSAIKQITIHGVPTITPVTDATVCNGNAFELKAAGALNYIWKDDKDSVICSNCITGKVFPKKNTTYTVVGVSEYGCSNTATTTVRVIQPFSMQVKPSDTICVGMSKQLLVSGAATYIWKADPTLNGITSASPVVTPAETTTYRVIGTDSYQCFYDTANIRITVGKPSHINAGADTSVLSGTAVQLHAASLLPDIRKWQWNGNATFSCINCASPVAKVIMDACLSCTATNIYGCTATDTVCITTFCTGAEVFVPNAFSPDGDGINDILYVQGRGIKLIKSFRVYSRWGELVFEKINFAPGDRSAGWDGRIRGKQASPDVFVYICEAVCEKGTPAIFKGNTAILK